MKFKIVILFGVFVATFLKAQELQPKSTKINYKHESVESYEVSVLPEANYLKKSFKKYIKDVYNIKIKGFGLLNKKDVLYAEDVTIPKISNKRLNLYLSVIEDSGESTINIFGSNGYLFFSDNSNKKELTDLKDLLVDFLKYCLPKYYTDKVQESNDDYQRLITVDTNLNTKINSNKQKIEELVKENEKLTLDIATNKENIVLRKQALIRRQEQLDSIKKQLTFIK